MSQHLDKMVLGDCILAKGPKGRFTYARNMKRHIGAPPACSTLAPCFRHSEWTLGFCHSDLCVLNICYICCRHGGGRHRHHAHVAGGEPHPQRRPRREDAGELPVAAYMQRSSGWPTSCL